MGSWHYHSCANDDVWDNLFAKNIHKMTDKETGDTLAAYVKKYPLPWDWSNKTFPMLQTYLGIVVHCVFQGRTIPRSHLERSLKIVNAFLDPEMITWRDNGIDDPDIKLNYLRKEKKAIEYALANDCRGKRYHVPGLLEQML